MIAPADLQAAAARALVDELARGGVGHAVVAPGSRSTPLVLALAHDDRIAVHVVLDERSAAFVALGIGRATGGFFFPHAATTTVSRRTRTVSAFVCRLITEPLEELLNL